MATGINVPMLGAFDAARLPGITVRERQPLGVCDVKSANSDPSRCSPYTRPYSRARRSRPGWRRKSVRVLSNVLLLVMAFSLLGVPLQVWVQVASAAPSGTWYKTDTHVHSVFSGDAVADLGVLSQSAKARGYDALFLTDHQEGSGFQISTWTANTVRFEDAFGHWASRTTGTPSATKIALASSPVNSGTQSLHLATTASASGESFLYEKRGGNLRSGDLIMKESVYPTRIDPGSGVYVSASIGGDPTVAKPDGYTTQSGVISPGKSTVLVWQLGTGRVASSDPNRRVLTYNLGNYTLNAWNTYTINVSEALNDIPAADRPLDYNALTYLKMATVGNGGTADAYFDSYSLLPSAPVPPGQEFAYRSQIVHDYDTASFKIFPAFEMGTSKHAQRFNFGITDPAQYPGLYRNGVDGILPTQQTGYPSMLNHPDQPGGATMAEAVANQAYGADFMEVKDAAQLSTWDQILNQDRQVIGSWSSDTHSSQIGSGEATYIYAPALQFDDLIHSFWEGCSYNAKATFSGRLIFSPTGSATEPYPARYPVYVPDSQSAASVRLTVTGGLTSGQSVRWVSDGSVMATDTVTGASYDQTKAIPLTGPWTYVRAEVLGADGAYIATTQPIFFRDVAGLPADVQYNVEGITTASGRDYTRLVTNGTTSSTWDNAGKVLSLGLSNPAGALIQMNMTAAAPPAQVRVDGSPIAAAGSQAGFDNAAGSSWYYDATTKRILLKTLQAGTTANVQVTFASGSPVTPTPSPSPTTFTVVAAADAEVRESSPATNYGGDSAILIDGGTDPDREGYLRFDVSELPGPVLGAKLRLFSSVGAAGATANGPAVYRAGNTWSETGTTGITWNTRPSRDAAILADVGKIAAGTWVEYDLGATAVNGNGTYSFALIPQISDGVEFHTRENPTLTPPNPPQL